MSAPLLRVWPPLPPRVWLRLPRAALPFPLGEPGCLVFARGRHALWQGARRLGLGPGDELLAPAYHHGSEIEALARLGVACRFYAGDRRLEPDEDELATLLGPRVRGLLLIHQLGFPQDASRWRGWCDRHGLLLVEDAAQAWLAERDGRPVGALGDIAIFCLYKTLGLPDGAALLAPAGAGEPLAAAGWSLATVARRHAAWTAARYGPAAAAFRALHRSRPYDAAADFALGEPERAGSRATALLVSRLADGSIAAERRARYRFLLSELGELTPAPFDRLPAGASPFAFPIEVDDTARASARLRGQGIEPLEFWSRGHGSAPGGAFPALAARRARTLALPVHQELRPVDLERIAAALRPPRRRRAELTVEPLGDSDRARAEWADLAAAVGDPFATWEWVAEWCAHLLGDRRLQLLACRDPGGRLAAILPLYELRRRPLRILRFAGSGPADRQGPVCLPGDRAAVARALRRTLAGDLRCDVLLADRLPGEAGWGALLGGSLLRREASPLLRIDGRSWEQLLAARSANFRQQVRARERRLARDFELRFRHTVDRERLGADFDTLVALHRARWTGRHSDAFDGARERFHARFAAHALRQGWLRLWFVELDERPVAAWYGFRYGGADWFYQAGRDPRFDHLSVGFVLMAHTVREAARDGMRSYHLLRGDEPYKARFAQEDAGLETLAIAFGAGGRLAVAGAAAGSAALPPRGRTLASRLIR